MGRPAEPAERFDETVLAFTNPADQLEKGIEHCRRGDWASGLEHLNAVAASQKEAGKLPGRYYSYMGYALASQKKQVNEGIRLCKFAIKQEFFQGDNYLNLARTYLLKKRVGAALKVIAKGLEVEPEHPELLRLQTKLNTRRPPVLPFLSRGNLLNQILGRLRHGLAGPKKKAPEESKA